MCVPMKEKESYMVPSKTSIFYYAKSSSGGGLFVCGLQNWLFQGNLSTSRYSNPALATIEVFVLV